VKVITFYHNEFSKNEFTVEKIPFAQLFPFKNMPLINVDSSSMNKQYILCKIFIQTRNSFAIEAHAYKTLQMAPIKFRLLFMGFHFSHGTNNALEIQIIANKNTSSLYSAHGKMHQSIRKNH